MTRKIEAQSFYDHMEELRERLIKCVLAVGACIILAYQYRENLLAFILDPVGPLIFTSPADAFLVQFGLSFFAGLLLASPVLIYQVWTFVAGALRDGERKVIYVIGPLSFLFFAMGAAFAYYAIVPFSMKFLLSFSNEWLVPMLTVGNYISFVVTMVLAFGVVFQFPLLIMFLTKIGVATPAFLAQKRRHAIVLIFIVSAVITPPDAITMWMMAVPLIALYEISILVSRIMYRQRICVDSIG